MCATNRIKVMIVDDSGVVRQLMTAVLAEDPSIEIIGAAADPIFAYERMKSQWPDVTLLDVEMPRIDGITFLKKLMHERSTLVVLGSNLTEAGAATTGGSSQRRRSVDYHQAEAIVAARRLAGGFSARMRASKALALMAML